jgi:hypothetical protein
MPAGDTQGERDALSRRRERDKQNQRRKRQRDRDAFQELEQRNRSLEQHVRMLQRLTVKNRLLSERLECVDEFVRHWNVEEQVDDRASADHTTNSVDEDGDLSSLSLTGGSEGVVGQGSEAAAFIPDPVRPRVTGTEGNESNALFRHLSDGPGTRLGGNLEHSDHRSNGSVLSISHQGMSKHFQQTHSTEHRPVDILLQNGKNTRLMIPISKLEDILGLLEHQRLPVSSPCRKCFDPFGPIVRQMRRSPDQFEMCTAEPNAWDLVLGASLNPLANAIFDFTAPVIMRRTEKLAIAWISYMLTRVITSPSMFLSS